MIAQGTEFPLRKPAGFHWDLFLLGLTTGVAGLLGIPFPNGLIPQAPFHTSALCVKTQAPDESKADEEKTTFVTDHVVEQRVSNLAQGLLTLATMSAPILEVLHLIPQGVLAGLFFIMGVQALQANGITQKLIFLAQDKNLTPVSNPLKQLKRRSAIWNFVILQITVFGATFAITQTLAAIGFPVFIILLIPIRSFLLPYWFTHEELAVLDSPTASPFTMESVGGTHGLSEPTHTKTMPAEGTDNNVDTIGERSTSNDHSKSSAISLKFAFESDLERGEIYKLPTGPSAK